MKQITAFSKALDKAVQRISKMSEQAAAVKQFYELGNLKAAYEHAMKLEETAERTVLLARVLPVYTGCPQAELETENIIKICMPVEIGFTSENWFSIRIPALLPKKTEGSADYIRSSLYLAMRDFFVKAPPVRYRDCVLIYRHVYDETRPERQKRDHDNIEINMVSDIVAMYVMPDDGPDVCSHYYCSSKAAADRTEVYVVPKRDFTAWLEAEPNMPDEGVKLYEKTLLWRKKHM